MARKNCEINIEQPNNRVGDAFLKSREQDAWTKYKMAHVSDLGLNDAEKAMLQEYGFERKGFNIDTLKSIKKSANRRAEYLGIYSGGESVMLNDTYYKLKKQVKDYAETDSFMDGLLKPLYGDDTRKLFEMKEKLKNKVNDFFNIIERTKDKNTQINYLGKLIENVIDPAKNDINIFLMIEPRSREIIKSKENFSKYFGIGFNTSQDYLKLQRGISMKGGISFGLPDQGFKIVNGKIVYDTGITAYRYIPTSIRDYYYDNVFIVPESVGRYGAGEKIYITNATFKGMSWSDQEKLYGMIMENVFKNPELSIASTMEMFAKRKSLYIFMGAGTIAGGFKAFWKMLTGSRIYNIGLLTSQGLVGGTALFILNSMRFITDKLVDLRGGFGIKGDWLKFYDMRGLGGENDELFAKLMNGNVEGWIRGSIEKGVEIASAGAYNMADVMYSSAARKNAISEYINIYYPHMTTLEEFSNYLLTLPKELKDAELEFLSQYIDNKMFLRFNQSVDPTRSLNAGYTTKLPGAAGRYRQEALNVWQKSFGFFRNYMRTSSRNFGDMLKGGWKINSSAQVRDMIDRYIKKEVSRDELNDFIYNGYAKNIDTTRILSGMLYSFFMTKMILKIDYHSNGLPEEYDQKIIEDNFMDIYSLFFFPIEAWKRTDTGLILMAAIDGMSNELTGDENIAGALMNTTKAVASQATRNQYIIRTLFRAISKYQTQEKLSDRNKQDIPSIVRNAFCDVVGGFGYYLKDDLERSGFELYTPKTQTQIIKDIFGTRESAMKAYEDGTRLDKVRSVSNGGTDELDFWLGYNMPFYKDWKIGMFQDTSDFARLYNYMTNKDWYRKMIIDGDLPVEIMDDSDWEWLYYKNTQRSGKSDGTIKENMRTDLTFITEDGTKAIPNAQITEDIWHRLMLQDVDKDLFEKTCDLLLNAESGTQEQALQALNYIDAQSPGAGQKILSYIMNYESFMNLYYYKKYGDIKKNPSIKDEATRLEHIAVAKKYAEFSHITDKVLWNETISRFAYKQGDLADYIVEEQGSSANKEKYRFKRESSEFNSTDLKEVFYMQNYVNMAAAEGMPDAYKMYNTFSKLFSEGGRKNEDGTFKPYKLESMIKNVNFINAHIKNLGVSKLEALMLSAPIFLQSEKFIKEYMKGKTDNELRNDDAFQTWTHFLRGINNDINDLAAKAISEQVEYKKTGKDLSEWTVSFATKSGKGGKRNWKDYYNKYTDVYKELKNMYKSYVKYFNKFYIFPERNASPRYTKKERTASGYSGVLAKTGNGNSKSRKFEKQDKPGGYITQKRGKARPFTNWGDLDRIPDRRTKPKNRRTRGYAIGSKLWNKLTPGRRRYIKARKADVPTLT